MRHGFPSWFKNQSRTSPAENSVISVYDVLDYIRTTFDDAEVLDSIDADAAVNPGALQAWQSYRSETANKSTSQTEQLSFAQTAMDNASWNWDGVWESRSRKGIEASLSDIVLYGGSNKDDELVRASLSTMDHNILTMHRSDLNLTNQKLSTLSRRM